MRIGKLVAIGSAMLILLGGCWDSIDITEQNYGLAVALDGSIGSVSGIVQYADPSSSGGGSELLPVVNIKGDGGSISDFIGNIALSSNKVVTYEHLQLIVFGSEMYNEHIVECMQYFMRTPDVQKTADIVITDGSLDELMEIEPLNGAPLHEYVKGLLSSNIASNSKLLLDSSLIAIMRRQKDGHSFRVNKISFDKEKNEVYPDGFGIFGGGSYRGALSNDEADMCRWFGIKSSDFYLQAKVKGFDDIMGFRCVMSTSDLTAEAAGDGFALKIKVDADFILSEYHHKNSEEILGTDFFDNADIALNAEVNSQCREAVGIAQNRLRTDFLGFGRAVESSYPEWWEAHFREWDGVFSACDVEYDINCKLIGTGDAR